MSNVARRAAARRTPFWTEKKKPVFHESAIQIPQQARFEEGDRTKFFTPEIWAALQPAPMSALSAFAHRAGCANIFSGEEKTLLQTFTHHSFVPFYALHYPKQRQPRANERLARLGNTVMGLFAAEHVHTSYPHLPTRALKAAVSAYVGPATCAAVARELGAVPLLRWHRTPSTPNRPAVLLEEALASIPRAMTALVYQKRSFTTARRFVQSLFLSREVDLRPFLKFQDPKLALIETVQKFGRERPTSRLLKESGRRSISPIFVVGIYSGQDKLGEGFGSSLKMAEYRAAEDSLHRLYLTRVPPDMFTIPSATIDDDMWVRQDSEPTHVPSDLGTVEIIRGWDDRSGEVVGRRKNVEHGLAHDRAWPNPRLAVNLDAQDAAYEKRLALLRSQSS